MKYTSAKELQDRSDAAEQQWLNELALNMQDARMSQHPVFPSAEMRGDHENEDIEAENHPEPKTPSSQIAKTAKGRDMQMYAEEIQSETDDRNQAACDAVDYATRRDFISKLIEQGKLGTDTDGTFAVSETVDCNDLNCIKSALEDTRLTSEPEEREEVLTKVNDMVAKIEARIDTVEAPVRITRALNELTDLQNQVHEAVRKRQFEVLPYINEKLVQAARAVHAELDLLRKNSPDRLVDMISELRTINGPATPYKTTLIHFVRTHNSFKFSEDLETGLRYRVQEIVRQGGRKGGKSSFPEALMCAYSAQKQADDSDTFVAKVTKIPEKRLKPLLTSTTRQAA